MRDCRKNWDQLIREYGSRDYPLGMFVLGIFGFVRNLIGDEALMYMFYDHPEFLHEIGAFYREFYIEYMNLITRSVVPDFIMMWEGHML